MQILGSLFKKMSRITCRNVLTVRSFYVAVTIDALPPTVTV